MTKEEAIAKLKELKELLELEVITQEDYDKEKAILTPIILDKKTRVKEVDTSYTLEDKKERPISVSEKSEKKAFFLVLKIYIISFIVLLIMLYVNADTGGEKISEWILTILSITVFVLIGGFSLLLSQIFGLLMEEVFYITID